MVAHIGKSGILWGGPDKSNFFEMVNLALIKGKKAVNLGLGINNGIRRFKEKWGGAPFLIYSSVFVDNREVDLGRLAKKL